MEGASSCWRPTVPFSAIATGVNVRARYAMTAGAGFFAAGAVLTHEDLVVLAFGLGLAVMLAVPTKAVATPPRDFTVR